MLKVVTSSLYCSNMFSAVCDPWELYVTPRYDLIWRFDHKSIVSATPVAWESSPIKLDSSWKCRSLSMVELRFWATNETMALVMACCWPGRVECHFFTSVPDSNLIVTKVDRGDGVGFWLIPVVGNGDLAKGPITLARTQGLHMDHEQIPTFARVLRDCRF